MPGGSKKRLSFVQSIGHRKCLFSKIYSEVTKSLQDSKLRNGIRVHYKPSIYMVLLGIQRDEKQFNR